MIFDMPNVNFSDEEWIKIIIEYLNGWTEIPLNHSQGYDINELKFYDGLLGTLLRHTEKLLQDAPSCSNQDFIKSWKYQGKLYRVIHGNFASYEDFCAGKISMPEVNYHGMISHWTDDYTFEGLMYKLSPNCEYIILETDTWEHIAFDVNKFRKKYHCRERHTEKEREIIFPMYKENTKEYRMTIADFIKMKDSTEEKSHIKRKLEKLFKVVE